MRGILLAALLLGAAPSFADVGPAHPEAASHAQGPALPGEKTTHHTLELPGRTLSISATIGSLRVTDDKGTPQADVVATSFVLDGAAPGTRPVTFAINGGPGASSAWLNLGAIGPWRVPVGGDTISPSASPEAINNDDTWLDFTDLVFIDPPGTGYSRVVGSGEDLRRTLFSVTGDVSALAEVMRRWLETNHRLISPKFIVGESYGGFRAPLLVRALQSEQGVGVRGIVMISPVLDFGHRARSYDPLQWVTRLPSMVAAVRGAADRAALADAEEYAGGEYLHDLWRGERDRDAVARIDGKLAELLPAIEPQLIQRRDGRLDAATFERELHRDTRRLASAYDTSITSADPFPAAADADAPDPVLESLRTVLTSAMLDILAQRLQWTPEGQYEILNETVNRQWQWGHGVSAPESYTALRTALAFDPKFRALVAHGLTDLVTPYFASKLILDQIPDFGQQSRLSLAVYAGGHMLYTRDESRRALRRDAEALIEAATAAP